MIDELRAALGDAGLVLSVFIAGGAAIALIRAAVRTVSGWLVAIRERRRRAEQSYAVLDRIEREIFTLSKRLDLSMSQAGMATATTNNDGNWTEVSRAMQRQTNRTGEELIGRGWYDAIDEMDRGEVIRRWEEAVRDHREFEAVFSWHRPDNQYVLVRLAAWYVHAAGGYVVNSRALDPRAWAEEQERANGSRRRRATDPPEPQQE